MPKNVLGPLKYLGFFAFYGLTLSDVPLIVFNVLSKGVTFKALGRVGDTGGVLDPPAGHGPRTILGLRRRIKNLYVSWPANFRRNPSSALTFITR